MREQLILNRFGQRVELRLKLFVESDFPCHDRSMLYNAYAVKYIFGRAVAYKMVLSGSMTWMGCANLGL